MEGNLSSLETNLPGMEGNLSGEETNLPGLEGNVPGLETNPSGRESNISWLETKPPGRELNSRAGERDFQGGDREILKIYSIGNGCIYPLAPRRGKPLAEYMKALRAEDISPKGFYELRKGFSPHPMTQIKEKNN